MGKNMYIYNVEDEFKDINPSCLGRFIHHIDYHYLRQNVKKMLPYKRTQGQRAKGYGGPYDEVISHDSGEQKLLLHEEEKLFHVGQRQKESAVTKKRSLRARIKALIVDQSTKEANGKKGGSRLSSRSQLQRTYSIHHREPQDHVLGEICTDWEHPIILFPGINGSGSTKLGDLSSAEKPDACSGGFEVLKNKDASKDKIREQSDILEIFKVNKDLFLEILQNEDSGVKKSSCALPPSKPRGRFTKSGSFPVADPLLRRNFEPSKLKHKQTEIWYGTGGVKFPSGVTLMPKEALRYTKNMFSKSGPSTDNRMGTVLGRALSLILESTIESDKEGNEELSTPCKESEQAVEFEVIDDRKEGNSSSFSMLGEVSNGKYCTASKQDGPERCLVSAINGNDQKSSSTSEIDEYDFSKKSTVFHKRSASLNESLDKYVGLFENNFGKEVKLQPSMNLRVKNENQTGLQGDAPVLFTRIRSLSHLEHYSSLQNMVHGFVNLEDFPITSVEETSSCTKDDHLFELKPVDFSTNEERVEEDDSEETGHQYAMLKRSESMESMENIAGSRKNITGAGCSKIGDVSEETDESVVCKSIFYKEEENNNCTTSPNGEYPKTFPVTTTEMIQDDLSSFEEFQSAEGWEKTVELLDEAISINRKNTSEETSFLSSMPNIVRSVSSDHIEDQWKNISNKKDDGDLDYVRDLLECSGFSKDAANWTWYSMEQPLGASAFEEMEAYWHQEFELSYDESSHCYHHQLLFDVVNEELVHLHGRSSSYYPKALSSSCRMRPFPISSHIVKEICTSISTLMSFKPEQQKSLDSVVDLDLRRDDYWMNLKMDSECIALEVEDMIFAELLDEVDFPFC